MRGDRSPLLREWQRRRDEAPRLQRHGKGRRRSGITFSGSGTPEDALAAGGGGGATADDPSSGGGSGGAGGDVFCRLSTWRCTACPALSAAFFKSSRKPIFMPRGRVLFRTAYEVAPTDGAAGQSSQGGSKAIAGPRGDRACMRLRSSRRGRGASASHRGYICPECDDVFVIGDTAELGDPARCFPCSPRWRSRRASTSPADQVKAARTPGAALPPARQKDGGDRWPRWRRSAQSASTG